MGKAGLHSINTPRSLRTPVIKRGAAARRKVLSAPAPIITFTRGRSQRTRAPKPNERGPREYTGTLKPGVTATLASGNAVERVGVRRLDVPVGRARRSTAPVALLRKSANFNTARAVGWSRAPPQRRRARVWEEFHGARRILERIFRDLDCVVAMTVHYFSDKCDF